MQYYLYFISFIRSIFSSVINIPNNSNSILITLTPPHNTHTITSQQYHINQQARRRKIHLIWKGLQRCLTPHQTQHVIPNPSNIPRSAEVSHASSGAAHESWYFKNNKGVQRCLTPRQAQHVIPMATWCEWPLTRASASPH